MEINKNNNHNNSDYFMSLKVIFIRKLFNHQELNIHPDSHILSACIYIINIPVCCFHLCFSLFVGK